jgi:hypothetical protein
MTKRGAERLTKLAEVLENFTEEKKALGLEEFDISEWHCGTAACALGTAALHPWFNRRGFRIADGMFAIPRFDSGDRTDFGIYAAASFFDITVDQGSSIFFGSAYDPPPTAKQVATRIRALVKDGGY